MRHCFCMCFSDSLLQLVMKTIQQYSAPQLLYVSVCLWYVWFAMSSLLEGYFCFCIFFNSLRHNVLISLLMRPSPEWFGSLQHPGPHLHLNFTRFSLSPPIRFLFPKAFPSYLVCFAFPNNFTSLLLLSLYSCLLNFWIPAFLIVLNPSSPHYCFVLWHWRAFTSPSGSSQCFVDVFSLWGVRLCTVYSLSAEQALVNFFLCSILYIYISGKTTSLLLIYYQMLFIYFISRAHFSWKTYTWDFIQISKWPLLKCFGDDAPTNSWITLETVLTCCRLCIHSEANLMVGL